MPKIRKDRGGGGGSSWGPALDGEGAIALLVLLAVVLVPIALVIGIGWGLWQLGIIVREKVFGDCLHDRHAERKPEFDVSVCTECGAWQALAMPLEEPEGEWQPRETNPGFCEHYYESTEIFESDQGRVRICVDCGCWRVFLGLGYWQPADTCPVYDDRGGEGTARVT